MGTLRYKAIAFDFDGVILKGSERINLEAAQKTFLELGCPLTPEEYAFVSGRSCVVYVPHFAHARDIRISRIPKIIQMCRRNYDLIWPGDAEIVPEFNEVLSKLLSMKVMLGIATTNRRPNIDRFLTRFVLRNPFLVIVTGEEIRKHKPHPEIYKKAARRFCMAPSEVLGVEDTNIGIAAAQAAGMDCAASPDPTALVPQDISAANYHIASFWDLLEIVC